MVVHVDSVWSLIYFIVNTSTFDSFSSTLCGHMLHKYLYVSLQPTRTWFPSEMMLQCITVRQSCRTIDAREALGIDALAVQPSPPTLPRSSDCALGTTRSSTDSPVTSASTASPHESPQVSPTGRSPSLLASPQFGPPSLVNPLSIRGRRNTAEGSAVAALKRASSAGAGAAAAALMTPKRSLRAWNPAKRPKRERLQPLRRCRRVGNRRWRRCSGQWTRYRRR